MSPKSFDILGGSPADLHIVVRLNWQFPDASVRVTKQTPQGAKLCIGYHVSSLNALDRDLIIGADGLNSFVPQSAPEASGTTPGHVGNCCAWLGADRPLGTLSQTFVQTDKGAMNAHRYWFLRLWCDTWMSGNRVLLGDDCHTEHFAGGSGTRLALDDAIALVRVLLQEARIDDGLRRYKAERLPAAQDIVSTADTSSEWHETFDEKTLCSPMDFAFDHITRSDWVDPDRPHNLSPGFMAEYGAAHSHGSHRKQKSHVQ